MQGIGIIDPTSNYAKRLDTYEFLETNGSAIISDLPQKEIEAIEKMIYKLLREDIDEDTTIPVSIVFQIMEATGRKKTE